jgi:hypothetical protein
VATLAAMKRQGWRPLLIARGGIEAHGHEVLAAAAAAGLRVVERLEGIHTPAADIAQMN